MDFSQGEWPANILKSTEYVHQVSSNGTKKANSKVQVKSGKRVVVAEQDWKVEDFDDEDTEETSYDLLLLGKLKSFS